MNAPTQAAHLAAVEIKQIPLVGIRKSPFNRKMFSEAKLQELVANIKLVGGVMSPVLVRALRHESPGSYELVFGERRWRAAKEAGLITIPAMVRDLSDIEVVELQAAENREREDVHPLDEAETYEHMLRLHRKTDPKFGAEQLAEKVGVSRSTIYGVLKLLNLCPEAREAFLEERFERSKAYVIARIPTHDLQREVLEDEDLLDSTHREFLASIQSDYMLNLKDAPFDTKAIYFKKDSATAIGVPCQECPKRTGNQVDLFTDVKNPNICTDTTCFAAKRTSWSDLRRDEIVKAGHKVHTDKKKLAYIFPYGFSSYSMGGGYVKHDATCYDDPKRRTNLQVVGLESPAIEYAQNPQGGELVMLIPGSAVTEALNAAGIKTERQRQAALLAKEKKKSGVTGTPAGVDADELSRLVSRRVIEAAHKKIQSSPLDLVALQTIAREVLSYVSSDVDRDIVQTVEEVAGLKKGTIETWHRWSPQDLPKEVLALDATALGRLLVFCAFCVSAENSSTGSGGIVEKPYGIDRAKIKATATAELKARADAAKKAAPPAAAKKAAAKAKKK